MQEKFVKIIWFGKKVDVDTRKFRSKYKYKGKMKIEVDENWVDVQCLAGSCWKSVDCIREPQNSSDQYTVAVKKYWFPHSGYLPLKPSPLLYWWSGNGTWRQMVAQGHLDEKFSSCRLEIRHAVFYHAQDATCVKFSLLKIHCTKKFVINFFSCGHQWKFLHQKFLKLQYQKTAWAIHDWLSLLKWDKQVLILIVISYKLIIQCHRFPQSH